MLFSDFVAPSSLICFTKVESYMNATLKFVLIIFKFLIVLFLILSVCASEGSMNQLEYYFLFNLILVEEFCLQFFSTDTQQSSQQVRIKISSL